MHWPKSLSPGKFLADYWQRKNLLLPDAVDLPLPVLEPDELAWLATQPDAEARLIFTDRSGDRAAYRVEYGPFKDADLNALPDRDWTLLVQDVEKHLPELRAYFSLVPFIPSWRIDDLMVSFAAPGGSVGPHKDNYDVFLCQGEGRRNWLLSDERNSPLDASVEALSLLLPFSPSEEHACTSGDVLYVPPGIPHWGIAADNCTTYSIGLRAPTKAELTATCARLFPAWSGGERKEECAASIFYADPDLQVSESADGRITMDAVRRIRDQELLPDRMTDRELIVVLGSLVTDPKAWLDPERPSADEVENLLQHDQSFNVHGMALIAWCRADDASLVFVNGTYREIPAIAVDLVRTLCSNRRVDRPGIQQTCAHDEGRQFVRWLLAAGVADLH